MIGVIARHELKRLALSPLAWGLAAAWQLLSSLFFNAYVSSFLQTQSSARGHGSVTAQIVAPTFGTVSLLLLLLLPLLAMNSLAGERRAGSLLLLQTAPVSPAQIIAGKYLGLLGYITLVLALLMAQPLSLLLAGPLDVGQTLLAAGGLWLIAAAISAVALAASAWCRQSAAAAGLALALLLPLWLIESATLQVSGWARFAVETFSLLGHYRSLREGLIDSADVLYYLLLVLAALALARAGLVRETRQRRQWLPRLLVVLAATLLLLIPSQLLRIRHDVSDNGWNSLSAPTQAMLAALPGPPVLTAYLSAPDEQDQLRRLLRPLHQARADFRLDFKAPELAEAAKLPEGTKLVLSVGARQETLPWPMTDSAERVLAPALARLMSSGQRWIVFVEGHGERSPFGKTPRDLRELRLRLELRGLTVQAQSFARLPSIPDNTALLVLASPESALPPADAALIARYVAGGGALLWLMEPAPAPADASLLTLLGLSREPGTVIDPDAYRRGTPSPAIALVERPESHELTKGLSSLIALPWAAPLRAEPDSHWQAEALLKSAPNSWAERGSLEGTLDQGADEAQGPLTLAWALSRPHQGKNQRVVVIGDGNFLSDGAIGNYGNAAFGLATIDWLLADTSRAEIPQTLRVDASLEPTPAFNYIRQVIFPFIISGLLMAFGIIMPVLRRR